ncbi:hypothetical protein AZF08_27215 [Bacillus gaemokensis]|nr:hypothetical protein AZF08_27215 [Bacillus gaemokensis]
MGYFKGKQFKQDIILVAVGYYCRFSLSYRDVSEIVEERGISVHPTPSCAGFMNMETLSIKFGRRKIKTYNHLGS